MYPGAVYVLISEDGLSLAQIWYKYSFVEMIIPLVAACWLGTPLGLVFSFIIIAFEVDI